LRTAISFGFIYSLYLHMKRQRVMNFYSGRVQGVGFRYSVKTVATGFEVTGTVRNLDDGRVELIAEGQKPELEEFLVAIRDSEVGRFIKNEQTSWSDAKNEFRGFEIAH
jgi:acylphosphatase